MLDILSVAGLYSEWRLPSWNITELIGDSAAGEGPSDCPVGPPPSPQENATSATCSALSSEFLFDESVQLPLGWIGLTPLPPWVACLNLKFPHPPAIVQRFVHSRREWSQHARCYALAWAATSSTIQNTKNKNKKQQKQQIKATTTEAAAAFITRVIKTDNNNNNAAATTETAAANDDDDDDDEKNKIKNNTIFRKRNCSQDASIINHWFRWAEGVATPALKISHPVLWKQKATNNLFSIRAAPIVWLSGDVNHIDAGTLRPLFVPSAM
jgi:hypothetical protein